MRFIISKIEIHVECPYLLLMGVSAYEALPFCSKNILLKSRVIPVIIKLVWNLARGEFMEKNSLAIWNRFVESGEVPQPVNPLIKRSWERCLEYNIDYNLVDRTEVLSGTMLKNRIELTSDLVSIATPVMDTLYCALRGTGFTLILADTQGFILKRYIDDGVREVADRVSLREGANWSERSKGTNAIGTSLAEGLPVKIVTCEHYVKENHIIACTAVPIFDDNGEILGTLDVTSEGKKNHERVFGMVQIAVQNIEKELAILHLKKRFNLYKAKYDGLLDLVGDGTVIVDENGTISEINSSAGQILGINPQDCLGVNIEELFNFNNMWVLDSGSKDMREITVSAKHGPVLVNARARMISDQYGNAGGILTLTRPNAKENSQNKNISEISGPRNIVKYTFDDIIGQSNYFRQVISICKRVARNSSTILLNGETGTGKEMLAQAIHQGSSRGQGPFVAVNCAAIPPELIESELFGYEEGAFTGAKKGGNPGKFELAHGGTIFLDEVGDMPLKTQVSLLRVLQEKQVTRVGGRQPKAIDVRIIAATHRNLLDLARDGLFRQDLFFRLNVVNVNIPPLRARKDDLGLLIGVFLDKYKTLINRPNLDIALETIRKLEEYDWPGNIRELENMIEGLVNVVEDEIITPADLPLYLNETIDTVETVQTATLKELEIDAICRAIRYCRGNLKDAAALLDIGRSTLYRKIKEFDIEI